MFACTGYLQEFTRKGLKFLKYSLERSEIASRFAACRPEMAELLPPKLMALSY